MNAKPTKTKSFFIAINIALFFILSFSLGLIYFFNRPPSLLNENRNTIQKTIVLSQDKNDANNQDYYLIKAGNFNFDDFCKQLLNEKKIRSITFTKIIFKLTGKDTQIKPGYYQIPKGMSVMNIIQLLTNGSSRSLINITLLEGYDIYQIAQELFEKKIISNQKDFIDFCQTAEAWKIVEKYFYLKNSDLKNRQYPKGISLNTLSVEGFFYPDTYKISIDISLNNLCELMIQNTLTKFSPLFNISPKNKKIFWHYLTMASLVEKETSILSEKPLVASVLVNRLAQKMKLRFDPTIIYALKINNLYHSNLKEGKINIKKKHFPLASSYNTYYRKGLPPGPICSPTIASFKACLAPAKTDYLFFVAKGDGSGEHNFSISYQKHLDYIEVYQKNRRKYR